MPPEEEGRLEQRYYPLDNGNWNDFIDGDDYSYDVNDYSDDDYWYVVDDDDLYDDDGYAVGPCMPEKTPVPCEERPFPVVPPPPEEKPWAVREELELFHAYRHIGPQWDKTAELFPGRSALSIEIHFNSSPELQRLKRRHHRKCQCTIASSPPAEEPEKPWDLRDEIELVATYKEVGPQWEEIAELFPGRSPLSVESHFNSLTVLQKLFHCRKKDRRIVASSRPSSSLRISLRSEGP
jgi:hypothetical protein